MADPTPDRAVLGDSEKTWPGLIFAQYQSVERLVDRLLPYFSIALNGLLAWHLLHGADRVAPVAYGRKYASLILRSLDISFL